MENPLNPKRNTWPAQRRALRALALTLVWATGWALPWTALAQNASDTPKPAAPASYPASCPPLLRHTHARLQDEKPQSLCQYSGPVVLPKATALVPSRATTYL